MAESLFIQLGADGAATWAAYDPSGGMLSAVVHGPLAAARDAAHGRRVVALVPGTDVLCTQAELPAASQARLRQIAPFSLEDAFADDIEALVFAVGARHEAGGVAVAVVARERMDEWLAALRDTGLAPQAVYSEAEGVPEVLGTLVLVIRGARVFGRVPGQPPLVLDGLDLQPALNLLRAQAGENPPEHVVVYADADGHARFAAELAVLPEQFASVDVKLAADGAFPRMAATLAQRPGTNLLQGPYAPKSNWIALAKPWKLAAGLLVAAVMLGLVLQASEYWSLRRADEALAGTLATECERVVASTRPQACSAEVERRLRAAGAGQGGETFLSTLAAVAAARDADTRIDALSYRNRTMDLQLLAQSVPAIDKFARDLESTRRFTATIQSANQSDKGIEGRVQVAGGSR